MPIAVYKPRGKTPLECVRQYQKRNTTDVVISYAGRLDPMAEGVLLLLVGEENNKRREYEHFSKVYLVDVVFGIKTDTGDLMGIPTVSSFDPPHYSPAEIEAAAQPYVGTYLQRYHPYSSTRVNGKPLFYWAREGRLGEIVIPTHPITVESIQIIESKFVPLQNLTHECQSVVPQVHGEFRQNEIVDAWVEISTPRLVQQVTIKVRCANGGAYMRVLAEDMAKSLGTEGFASCITRTAVGQWQLSDCVQLW
ncbi:MAG: hypothetical protein WCJ70_01545 [bacterium]